MKSQIGIFLVYPFVIGLAILTMNFKGVFTTNSGLDTFSTDSRTIALDYNGALYHPDQSLVTITDTVSAIKLSNEPVAFVPRKGFVAFKEAIGFKESRGRYKQVNTLGYLGKYQFGKVTLNHFGVTDTDMFLNTPELQEQVFLKYLKYNNKYLKKHIEKYDGKTVGGIKVTKSGMLAAAHLAGPGGVRKYLNSNGLKSSKDAYGSSVKHYMKKFAGYNLDEVLSL